MAQDPVVGTELHYRDPEAALRWLQDAFGLETELLVTDERGRPVYARVQGPVGVVPEGPGRPSPLTAGGPTHTVTVALQQSVDDHLARARAAGARIVVEPRQEFYGDLDYTCADLEGHLWRFSQRVAEGGPPPEGWTVRFPNRERR